MRTNFIGSSAKIRRELTMRMKWTGGMLLIIAHTVTTVCPSGRGDSLYQQAPTPTQLTCLYYDHDNEASKCVYQQAPASDLILTRGDTMFVDS